MSEGCGVVCGEVAHVHRKVFIQMFAPNVGHASRAGRTEKKKKKYTTRHNL